MAVNHVPYTMMNFGRLMERLATGQEAGPVTLILSKDDVPRARSQTDLIVFVHLVGPDGRLVTQDDHELGRGVYARYFGSRTRSCAKDTT